MKRSEVVNAFWTKEVIEGSVGGLGLAFFAMLMESHLFIAIGIFGTVVLWGLNIWYVILKIKNQKHDLHDKKNNENVQENSENDQPG